MSGVVRTGSQALLNFGHVKDEYLVEVKALYVYLQ